ncbi:MAG: hypothetical protein KQJ78_02530 [Deltaproteobacteria bacterium]|nr:hypothetical protein [Deltaproteobacteria bacterium]
MRRILTMSLALTLGLSAWLSWAPVPAWAHRVKIFAYLEGGLIKGEAYMPGGGKAQDCPVEVYDAGGKLATTVKTDPTGKFSLKPPDAPPPLKLVLKAGAGHQAEFTLSARDLGREAGGSVATAAAPAPAATAAAPAVVSDAALAATLGRVLDQKLAPISAQLARLAEANDNITLHDAVGGLGWIMGLLGAAMYFRGRRGGVR